MTALDELTRTILLSRDYVSGDLTDEEICLNLQSVRVLCVCDLRSRLSSLIYRDPAMKASVPPATVQGNSLQSSVACT